VKLIALTTLVLTYILTGCATNSQSSEVTDELSLETSADEEMDLDDQETEEANRAILGDEATDDEAVYEALPVEPEEATDPEIESEEEAAALEEAIEEVAPELAEEEAAPAPLEPGDDIEDEPDYSLGSNGIVDATPTEQEDDIDMSEDMIEQPFAEEPTEPTQLVQAVEVSSAPALTSNFNEYIVLPGDSLSEIAAKVYGSARNWHELASENGLADPTRIRPGDIIRFQADKGANFVRSLESVKKDTVVVRRGDTLAKIAAEVMGDSAYWPVLWRMNADIIANPHMILENQQLTFARPGELANLNISH
jgi:nucleoid-associated protein YgaU